MFKFLLTATAAIFMAAAVFTGASAANEARVRVVHASPDAPAVDVYANGSRVLSNVAFRDASDYLTVPAGTYNFEVFAAGTTTSPVLSITENLQSGKDYTVVALDRVSALKSRVFEDNNAAPASGKAHVQVIHASPNAPAVDIALRGGAVLVPGLAFGEKAGPLPVDAGTYNLEVRAAGTSTVALPLDGVQLAAGRVYTVIAVGLLGETPPLSVITLATAGVGGAAAAPVSPPHTGDAGLAAGATTDNTWAIVAAGIAVIVFAGFAGSAAVRARR